MKIIQLQLYTSTQIKTGQINSILFKGINFKGMINVKIKMVVTLKRETVVVQWLGLNALTEVAQV